MFTLLLLLLSPSTSPSPRVEDPKAIEKQIKAWQRAMVRLQFRIANKELADLQQREEARRQAEKGLPPKK